MPAVARVFVAHPVLTPDKQKWKFDISRIIRLYGELVTVLDSSDIILKPEKAQEEIARVFALEKFNPQHDFFLAAGDMTVYAAMLLVSAQRYGATPQQLRHNRWENNYDTIPVIECNFIIKEVA